MKSRSRVLSSIIVILIMLFLISVPGFAVDDPSDTTFQAGTVVVDGNTAKTVSVSFYLNEADTVEAIQGNLSTSLADGKIVLSEFHFDSFTFGTNDYANTATGNFKWASLANSVDFAADEVVFYAVYSVAADTPAGSYPVELYIESLTTSDYGFDDETVSSNIIVTEAAPVAKGFELYYTLNSDTDTEPDNFMEYDIGDTVTATIFLKSNTAETLQAFDLYILSDSRLTYSSFTTIGSGIRVTDPSENTPSTNTLQHIRAYGEQMPTLSGENRGLALPAGVGIQIATVSFTVSDNAVYNEDMPITISAASNIGIANSSDSYYPNRQDASSSTLGAETLKTYTVTYYDNVDGEVIAVPAAQTKQHGVDLALDSAVPTRTGYTFKGWSTVSGTVYSTDDDIDYAPGETYDVDADLELYALWKINTFTVTWKNYDGSQLELDEGVEFNTAPSYNGSEPEKPQTVDKVFTFKGWNVNQNAQPSDAIAAGSLPAVTADVTYYAIFEESARTYTVTWKNQDGSDLSTSTIEYNQSPAYQNGFTAPTKDEDNGYTYTFAGWATSPNAVTGTALGSLPAVTGDATYYAAFTPVPKTFNVTLETNGGTINSGNVTGYTFGTGATLPTDITKTGYTFGGWYTGWDSGSGTVTGDEVTAIGTDVYGDKTYYAKWTENKYNVKYVAGVGTGLDYTDSDILYTANYTIKSWSEVGFTAPTGYVFAGWSASNSQTYTTGQQYTGMSATDGDTIVLTATWAQDVYNITYAFTDGTNPLTSVTNGNAETYSKAAGLVLTAPTKDGYTFTGWTAVYTGTETAVTLTDGNTIPSGTEGDITLTATFEVIEYTITYDANGGTVDPATQQYTVTSTDALAIPTRDGYDFAGWKNEGAAVGTWDANETTSASGQNLSGDWGNVTLTAQWTVKTYTITFDVDGVETSATYNTEGDATIAGLKSNPTKNGYTFTGWAPNGSGNWGTTTIAADNTATTTVTGKYADVTLTAQWEANVYHVYFHTEGSTATGNSELVTNGDKTFTAENGSITAPDVPAKSANADWYEAGVWSDYDTTVYADQDVYVSYAKKTFTVTFYPETGDTPLSSQGADNTYDYGDRSITPPDVPEKPGYTGSWPTDITDSSGNKDVRPVYTPIYYTITFVVDGGTAIGPMTYNIESTDALPSATGKANFAFANWKVTTADGNWAADSAINGGTAVTGKYGNVTLTAQWRQDITYVVEEYKYAPDGYKLLIIDADGAGDGNVYTYDGATMYYTTDTNYMFDKGEGKTTAVFYTLIPATDTTLTDAQVGKIAASAGTAATITYDGDINGDGTVNIADANAIYQMVVATGSYYSLDQLTIAQRLAADTVKATANAEHRGSIEDVNAVVQLINAEIESLSNASNGTIEPQGSVYWLGRKFILAISTPAEIKKSGLCI